MRRVMRRTAWVAGSRPDNEALCVVRPRWRTSSTAPAAPLAIVPHSRQCDNHADGCSCGPCHTAVLGGLYSAPSLIDIERQLRSVLENCRGQRDVRSAGCLLLT